MENEFLLENKKYFQALINEYRDREQQKYWEVMGWLDAYHPYLYIDLKAAKDSKGDIGFICIDSAFGDTSEFGIMKYSEGAPSVIYKGFHFVNEHYRNDIWNYALKLIKGEN